MGTGFVMVENLFRGPPGEHPLHRRPFLIRVIREIRGSTWCSSVEAGQLRIGLARTLPRELPEAAGKYLAAVFDETDRLAVAEQLSRVPEFTLGR